MPHGWQISMWKDVQYHESLGKWKLKPPGGITICHLNSQNHEGFYQGQRDGSVGKGTWLQAWHPEACPHSRHVGRRVIPVSCLLSSTCNLRCVLPPTSAKWAAIMQNKYIRLTPDQVWVRVWRNQNSPGTVVGRSREQRCLRMTEKQQWWGLEV